MAKYLNLQIPRGCAEDWQSMLPDKKGKFCISCQKQVIDFTKMSDREIVTFFKKQKQNTCGRFSSDQLGRDILIPSRQIPWLKYFFRFTLPAFLFSIKANAQSISKAKPPIEAVPLLKAETSSSTAENYSEESVTIDGVVLDEAGQPVIGATILVKGTGRGVAADTAGKFILDKVNTPAILTISSIGFDTQELRLAYGQKKAAVILYSVRMRSVILGGAVGGVVVRSTKRKKKIEKTEVCIKPVQSLSSLSLYPNPLAAHNPLRLKWQGLAAGSYIIEVYSASGALMHRQRLFIEKWMKEYELKCELVVGNYFIRLGDEKTGKFLSQQLIVTN